MWGPILRQLPRMFLLPLAILAAPALAQSSASSSTVTAPPSSSSSAAAASGSVSVSTDAVTTATPTVSVQSTQTIGGQGALPPMQTWCPSSIFCAGPLLQALNLAQPYADAKTIVDKPTNKSSADVLADFNNLVNKVGGLDNLSNLTVGDVVNFLETDFVSSPIPNIPSLLGCPRVCAYTGCSLHILS